MRNRDMAISETDWGKWEQARPLKRMRNTWEGEREIRMRKQLRRAEGWTRSGLRAVNVTIGWEAFGGLTNKRGTEALCLSLCTQTPWNHPQLTDSFGWKHVKVTDLCHLLVKKDGKGHTCIASSWIQQPLFYVVVMEIEAQQWEC